MDRENLVYSSYRPTPFSKALLFFDFPAKDATGLSIFLRAVTTAFGGANFDDIGYRYIQLLEPAVVAEIERIEQSQMVLGCQHEPDALSTCASALTWLFENRHLASSVQRLNLAVALASFGRPSLAHSILEDLAEHPRVQGDLRFEYLMLRFAVSNRMGDRIASGRWMRLLKDMGKHGRLMGGQLMDAAAQAIVWHLKTGEVDVDTYKWFFSSSTSLLRRGQNLPDSVKSAWYRSVAMIPAATSQADVTRKTMSRAESFAKAALQESTDPFTLNDLKTYLESALKEHIYLSKEFDKAESIAIALLKLDPHWSPNWFEVAELYMHIGKHEKARQMLLKAIEIGPPYLLLYHYHLAESECQLGDSDTGVQRFSDILAIDSTNRSSALSGLRWARKTKHIALPNFITACNDLSESMSAEQRQILAKI